MKKGSDYNKNVDTLIAGEKISAFTMNKVGGFVLSVTLHNPPASAALYGRDWARAELTRIVTAGNAHDELVEALERVLFASRQYPPANDFDWDTWGEQAEDARAKAKGGSHDKDV